MTIWPKRSDNLEDVLIKHVTVLAKYMYCVVHLKYSVLTHNVPYNMIILIELLIVFFFQELIFAQRHVRKIKF